MIDKESPSTRWPGRVLFSAAEESFSSAVRELRDEFGRLDVERLGPDAGVVHGPAIDQVSAACRQRPLVFLRHLTVEQHRVPRDAAADLDTIRAAALCVLDRAGIGERAAVQAWISGSPRLPYGSGELASQLTDALTGQAITVSRAGAEYVLSACATPHGVSLGVCRSADSLADWPGGRVRLRREAEQISRAEFKLEELALLYDLRLPAGGTAIDLGAAPGGWTRILRRYGLAVWAVDPGELDPRVAADPGVRQVRTTAGEFLRGTDVRFDVAVDDMRMDPLLTCDVLLDVAPRLRTGGLAVVTLKIGTRQPVDTVRRCLSKLASRYRVEFARQLHHNRHEVTVVCTKA